MKTQKLRLVSALLALAMMLALLPTAAFAAEDELPTSGTCGKNLRWTLDSEGTLTISGTGEMKDFNGPDQQPWEEQRGNIKKLVVEDGVTTIGNNAFSDCYALEKVDLSKASSLEVIKTSFLECTGLESVKLNEGLKTIDGSAFSQCGNLEKIHIPSTVTAIGSGCFLRCTSLSEVTFADGIRLERIEGGTFFDCSGLKEITIPKSVEEIRRGEGYGAFQRCSGLKSVIFEPGSQLKDVDRFAFDGCDNMTIYCSDEDEENLISALIIAVDLYKIKPLTPTVTFESNGGSVVDAQTVENGKTISAPTAPTRKGYDFAGWYADEELTVKYNFSEPVTVNLTLYAQWQLPEAPVTYQLTVTDGTAWVNGKQVTEAAEGDEVTIEASETALEGMTFERWEVRAGEVKLENDRAAKTSFTMPAGEVQLEAVYQIAPAVELYPIAVDCGTAYDAEGNPMDKAAVGDVVTIEASETALEGMTFERWEVRKGEVKLENDRAAKTTFTMPAGEVQLEAMYQTKAADANDSGWDAATVVTGAVLGTGTAILAYHIGMEVYAEQVLGKDVAVPRTRGEVALLAWQLAGKPEAAEGEPLSEAAQAEKWAVESGLMQPVKDGSFAPEKKMSKWKALRVLEKAKQ